MDTRMFRAEHPEGEDLPHNRKGFIKNLFDGGFEGETPLDLVNDLVEQLPDSCRDPQEVMIEQEEKQAWIQSWPKISRWAWLNPETALLNYPAELGVDTDKRDALSQLAYLTKKQRRMTWAAYQAGQAQCSLG